MGVSVSRILLTGGAGFIGAHVAEHILRTTGHGLVILVKLDTTGNLNRLSEMRGWNQYRTRCRIVHHDLRSPIGGATADMIGRCDRIYHLAAGTHVDRSISAPLSFVYDNVVATCNLLDYARGQSDDLDQFVYFSTDEVFGPAAPGVKHRETDSYNARNPYAATKAGAEQLCVAFGNTYGVPVKIIHAMNAFGERQHPEKFIPMTIANVLRGRKVTIHADPTRTVVGSRFYLHARNAASAVEFIARRGAAGEMFNVVGEKEVDNLTLARLIAGFVGKPLDYELVDFHSSRPGHDLRYALDGSKLAAMGWSVPLSFEGSLERTVRWSLDHPEWLGA